MSWLLNSQPPTVPYTANVIVCHRSRVLNACVREMSVQGLQLDVVNLCGWTSRRVDCISLKLIGTRDFDYQHENPNRRFDGLVGTGLKYNTEMLRGAPERQLYILVVKVFTKDDVNDVIGSRMR